MSDLSDDLMLEFTSWFNEMLASGMVLPKTFSGVNEDGSQYIVAMSELGLENKDHLAFMSHVLNHERSIAYAFKMRIEAQICKEPPIFQERHIFYSGQMGSYYSVELTSQSPDCWAEGSKVLRESHTVGPEIFFQDILPPSFKASSEDARFAAIWADKRSKVMWRKRAVA